MVRRIFHFANILSIDVALGAVCSALFFAKFNNVNVSSVSLLVLALCVWVIYTIDHLSDARRISGPASSERHRFHQRYQSTLLKVCVIVAFFIVGLLILLPTTILIGGLILSSLVLLYLICNRYIGMAKEIVVAALYSLGVYLPSIQEIERPHIPIMLLLAFFVTAFLNLLLFSWYSMGEDLTDGHPSAIIKLGKRRGRFVIWLLYMMQLFFLFWSEFSGPFIILFVMCTMLMVVFSFPDYFKRSERYRIGDAVFFLSLTYLLL
jgi:hypothetical protein